MDELNEKVTLTRNEDASSKIEADMKILVYQDAWGWWLDVSVMKDNRIIYSSTIFADGRGTYEHLPQTSESIYSHDIAKYIKSIFSVGLERKERGHL